MRCPERIRAIPDDDVVILSQAIAILLTLPDTIRLYEDLPISPIAPVLDVRTARNTLVRITNLRLAVASDEQG